MERRREDTAMETSAGMYQATLGNASPTEAVLYFTILALMRYSIGPRSTWSEDAYLASANVIIEQCDKPG
jgi:hypothetical protein